MPIDYCWGDFVCNGNRGAKYVFYKHYWVYSTYIWSKKCFSTEAKKRNINTAFKFLWKIRQTLLYIQYEKFSEPSFKQKFIDSVSFINYFLRSNEAEIQKWRKTIRNNPAEVFYIDVSTKVSLATTRAVSGKYFMNWFPIAALACLVLIIGAAIFYRECVTGVSPVTGLLFYAIQPAQEKSFLLTDGSKSLSNAGNILPIEIDFDKKDNFYSESIRNEFNYELLSAQQFSKSLTCKNRNNVISISKYEGGYKNTPSNNGFKDQVSEGKPPILFFNRNISMV